MGPDVAVRWEATGAAVPPSEAARHALSEWAEARGFHLVPARETALRSIPQDLGVADAVEDDLARARDAVTALDTAATEQALSDADARLEAHPALPEAAWLRAEVMRQWAVRWQRLAPRDPARGAAAWARAAGLDGGRSTGVGEIGAPPVAAVSATLAPGSFGSGTVIRLDGRAIRGPRLVGTRGEHQLTVTRGGSLLWAGWVSLEAGAAVEVPLPLAAPCSTADLGRAHSGPAGVVATGVGCADWVFAREANGTSDLLLASCERDACGPVFRWSVGAYGPVLPPDRRGVTHWPAWATWTILGASALAVAGATLAAAGVFRPTHDVPMLTTGGLHVSSTPIELRPGE